MKNMISLFIFCFTNFVYCQELSALGGTLEIYTRTSGLKDNDTVSFSMKAYGSVWLWDFNKPYKIGDNFNGYSLTENGLIIIGNYNGWEKGWETLVPGGTHQPPYFSYGFYKIFIKNNSNNNFIYFYLNLRDSDWDMISYPCGNDIYLYYNGTDNTAGIKFCQDKPALTVSNGQILNFWMQKGKQNVSTFNFLDFWQNCLVAIPEESSDDYYTPHLVWGAKPDFNATSYKIYRAIGNSAGLSIGNYSLISTTSVDVFEYIDEEIDLSDNQ